jgi:hypothetical protein
MIELYFVLPMRKLDDAAPSVEVMTLWAHGFACMVILHGSIQIVPNNNVRELIAEVCIIPFYSISFNVLYRFDI